MIYPLVALRHLARIVNGGTPSSDEDNWGGGVAWATPVDLSRTGMYLERTDRTLTEAGLTSGSRAVPAGSVVLSTRAPIGSLAISRIEMAFNQGCKGLVPATDVDPRFLAYQRLGRKDDLQAAGQGSTFMEFSGDALAGVRLSTPSLAAQRQIADFLDDQVALMDRAIHLREQQIDLTRERDAAYLAGVYQNLSLKYGHVRLGLRLLGLEQGWSPQCEERVAGEGEYGVLKAGCVNNGVFRPEQHKALPETIAPRLEYLVAPGDLVDVQGQRLARPHRQYRRGACRGPRQPDSVRQGLPTAPGLAFRQPILRTHAARPSAT